jgi:hypothetical protein
MAKKPNPFAEMGFAPHAFPSLEVEEVRKLAESMHKALAWLYHPDRTTERGVRKARTARFFRITEAWNVIKSSSDSELAKLWRRHKGKLPDILEELEVERNRLRFAQDCLWEWVSRMVDAKRDQVESPIHVLELPRCRIFVQDVMARLTTERRAGKRSERKIIHIEVEHRGGGRLCEYQVEGPQENFDRRTDSTSKESRMRLIGSLSRRVLLSGKLVGELQTSVVSEQNPLTGWDFLTLLFYPGDPIEEEHFNWAKDGYPKNRLEEIFIAPHDGVRQERFKKILGDGIAYISPYIRLGYLLVAENVVDRKVTYRILGEVKEIRAVQDNVSLPDEPLMEQAPGT